MLRSGQKGLFTREKVPKEGICKPGARRAGGRRAARRVQEGTAGLGLRTKTEFIGFHGRRARTGGRLPNRFRAPRPPKFAYENRIHWLTEEAYANRETLPAEFRRVRPALVCVRKPNSLAYRGSVRKPGGSAGRVQEGPAAKVRARKPNSLAFRAGEREPGKPLEQIPDAPVAKVRARKPNLLTFTAGEREPGAPAQQIPGARRAGGREAARPGSGGAGRPSKTKKL